MSSADVLLEERDVFSKYTYPKKKNKEHNIPKDSSVEDARGEDPERRLSATSMTVTDHNFVCPANVKKKRLKLSKVFVNIVDSDCEMTTAYVRSQRYSETPSPIGETPNLKTKSKKNKSSSEACPGQSSPSTKKSKLQQATNPQDSLISTDQTPSDDSEVYFFDLSGNKPATFSPRVSLFNGSRKLKKNGSRSTEGDSQENVSETSFQDKSSMNNNHQKNPVLNEAVTYNSEGGTATEDTVNSKEKREVKSEGKDFSDLIKYLLDYNGKVEILDSNDSSQCGSSISSTPSKKKKKKRKRRSPKKEDKFIEELHKTLAIPCEAEEKNLKTGNGTKTENRLGINDVIKERRQEVKYKNGEKTEQLNTIAEGTISDDESPSNVIDKKVTNNKYESSEVEQPGSKLLASLRFVNAVDGLMTYFNKGSKGLDCFMKDNNTDQVHSSTPLKTKRKKKRKETSPFQEYTSLTEQVEEIPKSSTVINTKRVSLGTDDETQEENYVDVSSLIHTVLKVEGEGVEAEVHKETSGVETNSTPEKNNGGRRKMSTQDLNVTVPFEISPLHAISTKPSKFSKEEMKMIQSSKIPVKQGRFTKIEDDQIISNWKRFQKEHDLMGISPSDFFSLPKHMTLTNRLNFVRYIAHGLDDRPLPRVHQRFKLLFNKPSKANTSVKKFTEEEDSYILRTIEKYGPHQLGIFKSIGDTLGRCNKVVAKRYQLLTTPKEERQAINWDINRCSKLVTKLLKITKFSNVEQLREFEVPNEIFQTLSKKMKIAIKRIKKVYLERIHPRLFADEHLTADELKKIIIKKLYDSGVEDLTLVDWKDIAKHCHGVNAVAVAAIFTRMVRFYIPKEQHRSFSASVRFLYKYMQHNDFIPSKVKTWTYKDGQLEVCSDDLEVEDSESEDSAKDPGES